MSDLQNVKRISTDLQAHRQAVARLVRELETDGSRPREWRMEKIAELRADLAQKERQARAEFTSQRQAAIAAREELVSRPPMLTQPGTVSYHGVPVAVVEQLSMLRAEVAAQRMENALASGRATHATVARAMRRATLQNDFHLAESLAEVYASAPRDASRPRDEAERAADREAQAAHEALEQYREKQLTSEQRAARAELTELQAMFLPASDAELGQRFRLPETPAPAPQPSGEPMIAFTTRAE